MPPRTRYARSGDLAIAYQVLGDGDLDLVVGSGLAFTERGTHELRGVPGTWPLFAVARPRH